MSGPVVGTELMPSTCVLWEESSVISGYDDLWVQVWSEDTSPHGNGSVRESVSSCRADKNSLLEKVKLRVKMEGSEGGRGSRRTEPTVRQRPRKPLEVKHSEPECRLGLDGA